MRPTRGQHARADHGDDPVVMARVAPAALLVLMLVAGCTGGGRQAGTSTTTPVSQAPRAPASTPAPPPVIGRSPSFPHPGDECLEGAPPFSASYLPAGVDPEPVVYRTWIDSRRPPGFDAAYEPYDPHFLFVDPRQTERRIEVYHANSWRLDRVAREELTVLGRAAWLSDLPSGAAVIDFEVDDSGTSCAFWALSNRGVSEAELRRVVDSLRPA